LDGIEKSILIKHLSLQSIDLEDASPLEQSLPYARCLDKRFKGEKVVPKELTDPITLNLLANLDISEIEEGYEDVYLTSF